MSDNVTGDNVKVLKKKTDKNTKKIKYGVGIYLLKKKKKKLCKLKVSTLFFQFEI